MNPSGAGRPNLDGRPTAVRPIKSAVRWPSGFGRPAPDGHTKEPGRPPDGRRTDLDGAGRRWTALDGAGRLIIRLVAPPIINPFLPIKYLLYTMLWLYHAPTHLQYHKKLFDFLYFKVVYSLSLCGTMQVTRTNNDEPFIN